MYLVLQLKLSRVLQFSSVLLDVMSYGWQTSDGLKVPFNFGHTVAEKAAQHGVSWGDCGSRIPAEAATVPCSS